VLLGTVTLMFDIRKGVILISYGMYCAGVDCRPEKSQLSSEDERNLLLRELDCDNDEWAQWSLK